MASFQNAPFLEKKAWARTQVEKLGARENLTPITKELKKTLLFCKNVGAPLAEGPAKNVEVAKQKQFPA